jgi:hypothetical protein
MSVRSVPLRRLDHPERRVTEDVRAPSERTVLIDAHVHVHSLDRAPDLLDAAWRNMTATSICETPPDERALVLMLTEMQGQDCFAHLSAAGSTRDWRFIRSPGEAISLRADRRNGAVLLLVAGRQIVTAERIEVLALACRTVIPDGLSLSDTLRAARAHDALVVLPWGFGKWSGRRGALVRGALEDASSRELFIGDNGGRARLWPTPELFRVAAGAGIRMLSGADPLPLPGEHLRVGQMGSIVRVRLSHASPATDLARALQSPDTEIESFGRGLRAASFVKNQLALRLRAAEVRS